MKRKIYHQTQKYAFVSLEKEDLELIRKWRNEQMRILRQNKKLTSADQEDWYKKVQAAKDQKIYSILNGKTKLVGYCGLTNFDNVNKRAEISFLAKTNPTHDAYEELFSEVLTFLKNEAFNKFKLHKLFTETYSFRSEHLEVLRNNGFTKTGVLRDHILEGDEYFNSYIHSTINENCKIDNLKDVPVLVTGGAGVIGQELIQLLVAKGANVRCVDFRERPDELHNVDYWQLDLSDCNAQFLFRFQPQFVFHLAADFERSIEDIEFWDSNFQNNVIASHNLLSKIKDAPSVRKIVFASSYLIYEKRLYNNVNQKNILKEDSAINPRNLTGIAKLQTERDIEFFHENLLNNIDYASARIFRAYGRGSRDIISRWVRAALNNKAVQVFGDDNSFDYIHAQDVAQALVSLALSPQAIGIFNVANGEAHSIADVIKILQSHFHNLEVNQSNNEIYPESSQADIYKIQKTTGWSPKFNIKTGIEDIIKYEKSRNQ